MFTFMIADRIISKMGEGWFSCDLFNAPLFICCHLLLPCIHDLYVLTYQLDLTSCRDIWASAGML